MASLSRTAFSSLGRRLIHHSHVRRAITTLEMPAMSPTMTEGGIAGWKKMEGESFAAGDVLLEIETDKATIDVEAQDDGVMGKILIPEGTKNIVVGKAIALLAEEGDDISNLQPPEEKPSRKQQQKPEEKQAPAAEASSPSPSAPKHSHSAPSHSRPLFPSVYRLLGEHVVDPSKITGTGIRGMLTKGDVLAFLGKASGPLGTFKESPPPTAAATQPKKEEAPKPLDGAALRRLIVSTMLQNSVKARNPPSGKPIYPAASQCSHFLLAALQNVDFDSIIGDYLPSAPAPPKAKAAPLPPTKSSDWLDGLI
ncbi:unnamed protein product [Mycena citricolor]|uniref:Single hybrid motif-containing protein n=1 Tax=Mycena citricolor TaxID=2018698 RepID=A0AAD2K545_9AGAR|nr:unnamed protein product [Mycena citricolor]